MPFLNPKQNDDDGGALPGAPGLSLDLDIRTCPQCRLETPPWQATCPDCGVPTVPAAEIPPAQFDLPEMGADEEE
ncbi:MAG: hypothetical protein KG028_16565 [Actinobacteria bacterium]|jgi:rRNA maturation protein Nop10|nr:hypothetical protein [Actinomycetota bacterium]